MAISLAVTGNGAFQGSATNLSDYSVTEDATPIEGSDTSGGTGTIDFTVVEVPASDGSILLLNDTVLLTDGSNGTTTGTVYSVSSDDGITKVSANSRINAAAANIVAAPYTGTLGGALTYYFGLIGITTGIVIDSTITGRSVTYQNFSGSMWDYLKQLCVAQQIEISLVSNNVVARPIRSRVAFMQKNSKVSTSVANSDLAQTVQAWAYNNVRQTNTTMYPLGGNTSTVSAYQVDSGKTLTENIPVNVSIETLSQPVCVATSTLSPTYSPTSSVYGVSGQDGTPITPSAWTAAGGSVSVAIGADGKSIDLTIIAPTGLANAPFTIGVSNGPSSYYAGLFIAGTGVFFTPVLYTTATGSPLARTATIIGATVNNIFMSSAADAGSAMLATAQRWAAPKQTISVSATVVNRPGDKGDASYPTFANFDAVTSGTFAAFDTAQSGQSFIQFNAAQQLLVANNFENQAFGNIAGARVQYRDAWYRITTATISPSIITYTATADTIFSDFDTAWAGKTFAQFDTKWTGKAFADNAVIPLWT